MAERPEFQSDLFRQGKEIRGEVAGRPHLDAMLAKADDFSAPIQQLVTEYCWGFVWGRPGLERKTRSMLNLAMLATLGRAQEFKLHTRGALRNGVTRDEIREIIMQVGIYAGVPAMMEATRVAQEAFRDHEAAGE
ncbi:carboxymuconolactone decarboxylase family protein [Enterovirga sp.]|jgi:4-carboxymuconolactone decarboxylase|uniref:carboxymuconolactone decarboxylase family protein n=1 Tax=Enterovirga sp. TaxID=2026350 RepID=UPI002619A42B|nr:carboxymuconolactone decarboxylase family protein [Enterovirga sp.]MDB5592230.1 putative carboxymuconolactone decarboxylase [Enterovirga sp.]